MQACFANVCILLKGSRPVITLSRKGCRCPSLYYEEPSQVGMRHRRDLTGGSGKLSTETKFFADTGFRVGPVQF